VNIYFFQWISDLGGADTRLKDLIKLFSLNKNYVLYSIPNDDFRLNEQENINFFNKYNVKVLSWSQLPKKLEGVGISFCNFRLFSEDWRIKKIKDLGLKFIWSNDMMWHTDEELFAVNNNLIDAYLYTSEFHKSVIHNVDIEKKCKIYIISNYFDADSYQFFKKTIQESFCIGKHSRPDWLKFSDDFPLFYSNLGLKNPQYKVMGISSDFFIRFNYFKFDDKWELLEPNKEKTTDFLRSLDLYVYNSHPSFIENQSRAIIEALLNGLPVLAPNKYNFPHQIVHNQNGFLCDSYEDYKKYSRLLEKDINLRNEMSIKAHKITKEIWCNKDSQFYKWKNIFDTI
jgi:glycosyltransferase involved in cell wall biosynthesis